MLSFFNFGPKYDIELNLDDAEARPTFEAKYGDKRERLPLFIGDEDVAGTISVNVQDNKKLEHLGVKLEFIGQIEVFYDRGNHYEFTALATDFAPAGTLTGDNAFEFRFEDCEKPYESYNGINVRLRYVLRLTIARNYGGSITKEFDLWVQTYQHMPEINHSIKMEVGIEECLHIEFEYAHSKFHLKDCLVGKIYFLLVRIKIKHMEIALLRRETTGQGPNVYNESETVTKFEVMDGAPVRGECIPVRLFLGGFDLTPSYKNINNKFSVRYYVNLVLIDEEDRRYFKQQEIILWRKAPPGVTLPPRPTPELDRVKGKKKNKDKKKGKKKAKGKAKNPATAPDDGADDNDDEPEVTATDAPAEEVGSASADGGDDGPEDEGGDDGPPENPFEDSDEGGGGDDDGDDGDDGDGDDYSG